jgi:hypothetical protein
MAEGFKIAIAVAAFLLTGKKNIAIVTVMAGPTILITSTIVVALTGMFGPRDDTKFNPFG